MAAKADVSETKPTCHISATSQDGLVDLMFSDAVRKSTFIIDGQHRLKGMAVLEDDVLIPVCLFVSLSKLERAFQFVTINNKSHKVPTDNLKALIANFDSIQLDLRDRLTHASITSSRFATAVDILNDDPASPFFKMVDWVNNRFTDGKLVVPPTALENSLKAIERAFPETKDDESDSILVLSAIWKAIFDLYSIVAETAETYPNLMLKATIQTVSEMIVDKLKGDRDPAFTTEPITQGNAEHASKTAAALMKGIPSEFWQEPWKLKSLDTSAGRELIESDIRAVKKAISDAKGEALDWRSYSRLFKESD